MTPSMGSKLTVSGLMKGVALIALLLALIHAIGGRNKGEAMEIAAECARAVVIIDHPFTDFSTSASRNPKNTGWTVSFKKDTHYINVYIPDATYEWRLGWKRGVSTNYPVERTGAAVLIKGIEVYEDIPRK